MLQCVRLRTSEGLSVYLSSAGCSVLSGEASQRHIG